jgi:hypothetical protein
MLWFLMSIFSLRSNNNECNWRGHCIGAPCKTENNCSGSLICINRVCSIKNQKSKSTIIPTQTSVPTSTQTSVPTNTQTSVPTSTQTSVPTSTQTSVPTQTSTSTSTNIPIVTGTSAVLTYFTDTVFQCITGQPSGNAMAINPLLLGFTVSDWTNLYVNADPSAIPWCGKTMTITVNGKSFTGKIIDTCDRNFILLI